MIRDSNCFGVSSINYKSCREIYDHVLAGLQLLLVPANVQLRKWRDLHVTERDCILKVRQGMATEANSSN